MTPPSSIFLLRTIAKCWVTVLTGAPAEEYADEVVGVAEEVGLEIEPEQEKLSYPICKKEC